MQPKLIDSRATSLVLAAVVAAINPIVRGYFNISVEIGNDLIASVGGVNMPYLEILTSRVWTLDDNGNEIPLENVHIDTDLIESTVSA